MGVFHNKRRRKQHMCPVLPIDCPPHRIADKARLKRCSLELSRNAKGGIKRRFGFAVRHHFKTKEKPSASDVADVGVLPKPLRKSSTQFGPLRGNLLNKTIKVIPQVNQTLGVSYEKFLEYGQVGRENPPCS